MHFDWNLIVSPKESIRHLKAGLKAFELSTGDRRDIIRCNTECSRFDIAEQTKKERAL